MEHELSPRRRLAIIGITTGTVWALIGLLFKVVSNGIDLLV